MAVINIKRREAVKGISATEVQQSIPFEKPLPQKISFQAPMQKVYISGPISAPTKEEERRNVHRAGKVAFEYMIKGWAVFCPHTMTYYLHENFNTTDSLVWEDFIIMDLVWLFDCDAIHMLPGWRQSQGAVVEYMVAVALGLEILGEVGE